MMLNEWQIKSLLLEKDRKLDFTRFSKVDLIEMLKVLRETYFEIREDMEKLKNEKM